MKITISSLRLRVCKTARLRHLQECADKYFWTEASNIFWETSIYLIWSHHDHCCISPNVTFKILIQFLTRVDWVQWSEKIYKMFKQILSPSDLAASSLLQWQYNNIKSTVVRTILRWSVHGTRHKIKCFSRCCHCSGSCLITKDFQHD